MLLKSQQLKSTKFFIPDHDHTNPYFKNVRVNSCSKILVKNGQSLAIPYKIVNSKGKRLNHFLHYPQNVKNNFKSSYQQDYSLKRSMHVGMGRKPLVPYDPLSYRNRLPIDDFVINQQRKNEFVLGKPDMINRKRWVSTSKDSYKKPKELPISNGGIISDITKRVQRRLESII